jgi:hypothetical protein
MELVTTAEMGAKAASVSAPLRKRERASMDAESSWAKAGRIPGQSAKVKTNNA